MKDAIVIIPTYNEIENIEAIIRTVFSQPKSFDILVGGSLSSFFLTYIR